MKFREIKQHHVPAIISIASLFIMDSLAFYCAYLVAESTGSEFVGIKYPFRVFILIIYLIYIAKRYNPSPTISRSHESKTIIQLIYLIGIGYIFYRIISKSISIDKAQYDLVFLHSFIFIDILFRLFIRSTQRYFLTKGYGGRKTIIVGSGEDAFHLADEMNRNLSLGFDLQGYFNESESIHMSRYCTYLGTPEAINTYMDKHKIHEMIIVLDNHKHEKLLEIIGKFNLFNICIKIIPDMYEAITGQVRIDTIRGLPLLNINPDIITEYQLFIKRSGDISLALAAVIILFPFNLLIALLVKSNSRGDILYKQIRLGLNGKRFTLIKFRTMYENSEKTTGPIWAGKDDPRITSLGKILRKYHLDEIPQLLNVLRGDMSIIGPRPERPKIIDDLIREIPYYSRRLKVKPGITGWAQIMGVYDSNVADVHTKLKHDFYYIENMSLLLDLKIIFMTLWVVIRGGGH
mgnify:FL=1